MAKTFERLYEHLHRGGSWGYWWIKEGKRSIWFPIDLPEPPPTENDVYFGLHPVDKVPDRGEPSRIRASITDIIGINAFIAEFDDKGFESPEALKAHVSNLDPAPSVIIQSGAGWHCYWCLDEPLLFNSSAERQLVADVLRSWVLRVRGDRAASDLARILRVAGTRNSKYDPPREVTVKWPKDNQDFVLYSYDRLAKLATGAAKIATLDQTAAAVDDEIPKGSRNATLTSIIGSMHRRGMRPDEMLPAAEQININRCTPPLSTDELKTIVDSVAKYPVTLPATELPIAPDNPKYIHHADAIRALGYEFRLNTMADTIEINGQPISDIMRSVILSQMLDLGYKSTPKTVLHWENLAYSNKYHPVQEYLNGLTWDEEDHIGTLGEYFDGEYGVFTKWLKRWMIGACARVMMPGVQNRVLCLAGPQDLGKSYFAKWLGSPLPRLFVESELKPDFNDHRVLCMQTWLWEIGEFGSTYRRADRESLKFFLTMETITARKAYGREIKHRPAQTSFIGTFNFTTGFLSDPSGHRRFMTESLQSIDWSYSKDVDIHQCWAQAKSLYFMGEPWRLTKDEMRLADEINRSYEEEDITIPTILDHYRVDPDRDEWFTATTALVDTLKHAGLKLGTDRSLAMSISSALTRMGIKSDRRELNGRRQRGYPGVIARGAKDDAEEVQF